MQKTDEKQIIRIMTLMALLYIALSAVTLCFAAQESLSYTGELPPAKKLPLEWGKDPFTTQVKSASGGARPGGGRLTAVFYNEKNPSAIIDDMIVYRGSIVRGQKVIDIGVTHVILQGESGAMRLDLTGEPEPNGRTK